MDINRDLHYHNSSFFQAVHQAGLAGVVGSDVSVQGAPLVTLSRVNVQSSMLAWITGGVLAVF